MTVPIPLATLTAAGTSQDITGPSLTPGALLIVSRPALASTRGHGGQPTPPGWPKDRSGLWLRNAAAGLCLGHRHQSALARLGPHQTGRGCLYIKRLDEVDQDALRELIDRSARVRKGIDQGSGQPGHPPSRKTTGRARARVGDEVITPSFTDNAKARRGRK